MKKLFTLAAAAGIAALTLTGCDYTPSLGTSCFPNGIDPATGTNNSWDFSWVLSNETDSTLVVDDVTTVPALAPGEGPEWFEGQTINPGDGLGTFTTAKPYYGQDTTITVHVDGYPILTSTVTAHAECDI